MAVARIKLRYEQRPKIAERFVPRAEGEAGAGEAAAPGEAEAARPDEAKDAIEQAPEAEAAVDLWELDPMEVDWAERDLETWAMSRADEGWPEELDLPPMTTGAGGENAEACRPSPRGERSKGGNGGDTGIAEATVRETARVPVGSKAEPDAGDGSPVANRPDARDGSPSGDGKPASGLIWI